MIPDKQRIKARFTRAAVTYDDQAVIQHRVADRLLTLLGQHAPLPPKRVLEIGCCTGMLTRRLVDLYRGLDTLYVNDLVPEFREPVARRAGEIANLEFIAGDVEAVALPRDLDLVISSSTFHWLQDLPSLFARLADHMTPEGTLAFSMYSSSNLLEIREITGIGLRYYSPAETRSMVARHFEVLACEEELISFKFRDPQDILRHLRETGVNALAGKSWTRSDLAGFRAEYEKRFLENGRVRLTYHPLYCIARTSGS
jgi:malonyl-ACP O-methyltransferase BioC